MQTPAASKSLTRSGLLAAARVLPWRYAEPGGEIAPRFEHARVRYTSCDHRGDELADAWNLIEQPAHLTLRMGAGDCVLQIVDRLVEPLKMQGQNLHGRPGGGRKRRITFGQLKQLV